MKPTYKNIKTQGCRAACLAALALLFLLQTSTPLAAAPNLQTTYHIYTADVRDTSFVVSWTTDVASDGHVDWGTTTALGTTTSDSVGSTTTHYVVVTSLAPSTTYYFQIRSGTTTDNNGGAYYTVTTGPTLGIPTPGKQVWGYVYASNGTTPVPNAIVYLQIQDDDGSGSPGDSQWVTARTDTNGIWYYDLVNVRVANVSTYYVVNDGTDDLRLVTQGGSAGCVGENGAERIVTVPATYPGQFNTTLDNTPNAVTLIELASQKTATFSGPSVLVVGLCVVAGLFLLRHRK